MLLAVLPFLIWAGIAAAGALGIGIGVACSSSSGPSSPSGSGVTGGTSSSGSGSGANEPPRPLKPACLLAGYSGAGKSEFLCALLDFVYHNGQRRTHSVGRTISNEQPTLVISGIQMTCIDGPGNLEGGQYERYRKFLDRAFNADEPRKFVVIFVVDLSSLDNANTRLHVKSDLYLLNRCALEVCNDKDTLKDRRIKLLCVGSHYDSLREDQQAQLQNNFTGWFNGIVNFDFFDPEYVATNLYDGCDAAEKFCEYMEAL